MPGRSSCGLVQLRHSYDSAEMYGDNYGYRSSLNSSMVAHLSEVAAELSHFVGLRKGDLILDIGSNDGTLLSAYPESESELAGIDPTAQKFSQFYPSHVQLIPDFFSAAKVQSIYGNRKARIITSIAMFYDLDNPIGFMQDIRQLLAEDGVWHFEQSYLPAMLEANAYDTICHEHVEYYALRQIKFMTDQTGLKIVRVSVNAINGGSFAVTVAHRESPYAEDTNGVGSLLSSEADAGLDTLQPFNEFKSRVLTHRDALGEFIYKCNTEGQLILGYGASTKGNVILQFCNLTSKEIPYIADVNEEKFGCCTPGTGIPIISEKEARALAPAGFLVMPWHFRENLLRREERFLREGGKMIFPLPELEVVTSQ